MFEYIVKILSIACTITRVVEASDLLMLRKEFCSGLLVCSFDFACLHFVSKMAISIMTKVSNYSYNELYPHLFWMRIYIFYNIVIKILRLVLKFFKNLNTVCIMYVWYTTTHSRQRQQKKEEEMLKRD